MDDRLDSLMEGIVIIGMVGWFFGVDDVVVFWWNVLVGQVVVCLLSEQQLCDVGVDLVCIVDLVYVWVVYGFQDIDCFDVGFFGFMLCEVEMMDLQYWLLLECCQQVLDDGGYVLVQFDGLIGVYVGVGMLVYMICNLLLELGLIDVVGMLQFFIGNEKSFVVIKVLFKFGLQGLSVNVDIVCFILLVVVYQVCQSLLLFECDMVLVGGVSLNVLVDEGYQFYEGGIVVFDGLCCFFDYCLQGMVKGVGVGIVLLKWLDDVIVDGDCVYVVIKGLVVNNDGVQKVGFIVVSVDGQVVVIVQVLGVFGVLVDSIGYVEVYGIGIQLGDLVEIVVLLEVYCVIMVCMQYCVLGVLKVNIGYFDIVVGVVGLIKVVKVVEQGVLLFVIYFEVFNLVIDFLLLLFYVFIQVMLWLVFFDVCCVVVSLFGIGGINVYVIFEQVLLLVLLFVFVFVQVYFVYGIFMVWL